MPVRLGSSSKINRKVYTISEDQAAAPFLGILRILTTPERDNFGLFVRS